MKILHVISNLEVGGAQRVRLELVRRMLAHGDDDQEHLIVYFHDGPMRKKFENLGIKTEHVPVSFWNGGWSAWCRLSEIVNDFAPNLLHSQLWLANVFARLLAYKKGLPVICDLHSMAEVNGFWKNLFERFFPIGANAFVAVSDAVANDFAKKFGIQSIVIKNGVDSSKFRFSFAAREELRAELNIPENAFVVGAVGRFDAIKKFDNLIHAYALMLDKMQAEKQPLKDNCYLVLVGEGKLKPNLQLLAKELGLSDRVIFSSSLRSMYRYYSIFDCLAISSRSEGLSVAMLEALFSGLQVVCTAPAAQHDVIVQGKNGFLVPFGEYQIMADCLYKIATQFDAEFIERPSRINYEFDVATMAKRYQQLYLDVLKNFAGAK
jgi:glycosyltransferase involved in cell wall biosynthesis